MPVWPPGRSFSQSSFLAQRWITVFEPRGFAVTQWPCTLTSKPNCRLYHSAALVASFTSTATEPTSVNMMENWSEVDISMRVRSPPPPHPHLSGAEWRTRDSEVSKACRHREELRQAFRPGTEFSPRRR